jgi:carbon storage regulator
LVLSRRSGEEIVIGDEIRLTVVRVDGSKVRLGIVAPQSVSVRRIEPGEPQSRGIRRSDAHEPVVSSETR